MTLISGIDRWLDRYKDRFLLWHTNTFIENYIGGHDKRMCARDSCADRDILFKKERLMNKSPTQRSR